jgi:hypothetical protein
LLLHACSDEEPSTKSCLGIACLGRPVTIVLVDDNGQSAVASGSIREVDDIATLRTFNCGKEPPEARFPLGCESGVLSVATVGPSSKLEIQFALSDGSQSDWQRMDFELTEQTLVDFGGPDCPCSYYEGSSAPITVPSAAK